jgi:hypothetical protein
VTVRPRAYIPQRTSLRSSLPTNQIPTSIGYKSSVKPTAVVVVGTPNNSQITKEVSK